MTRRSNENKPTSANLPAQGNKVVKFNAQAQASGAVDKLFGARQGEQVLSGLKLIQHHHIEVKPQPRTNFSATEVAELASSISTLHESGEGIEGTGILQPLLVTLQDNSRAIRYRLIAGERRFRASQEAGLTQVPCLVVTIGENGVLPVQLIENLQRQNLAPLDEGRALQQLKDEQNLSIREIAKSLGKTRGYVTNRLDLLKMEADVQSMVSSREDTLKHAALINTVQDADLRSELIRTVIEESASVKAIENRISAASKDSFPSLTAPSRSSVDQAENVTTIQKSPVTSMQENLDDLGLRAEIEAQNIEHVQATDTQFSPHDGVTGANDDSYTRFPEALPNSHTGQNSPPDDFIAHSLQPAAALIATAAHQAQKLQLQNSQLDPKYKQQLRDMIKTFREHLEQIEQAIK